jgi:DNA-binding CsgD family transcriptional regulator
MGDTIRTLRPGEPCPSLDPRRYTSDSRGYVRLRWKIGVTQYVETYEHRVVGGLVVTTSETVHHRNEIKSDNNPGNLEPLTRRDHALHHKRPSKWFPYRGFEAAWKAARAENRRFDIAKRTEQMRAMSAQGMSTIAIGQALGIHPSAVSRYLTKGHNW